MQQMGKRLGNSSTTDVQDRQPQKKIKGKIYSILQVYKPHELDVQFPGNSTFAADNFNLKSASTSTIQ